MVRKIQSGEYLKRVDNMTAGERSEYMSRVGEWLSFDGQSLAKKIEVFEARLQNVLQVSIAWNDQECAAFEEGAVLMSALVGVADTKLPELLYAISAKRSIKWMFQLLWEAEASVTENDQEMHGDNAHEMRGEMGTGKTYTIKTGGAASVNAIGRMQVGEAKEALMKDTEPAGKTAIAMTGEPAGETNPDGKTVGHSKVRGAVPVRPKHIDQYVHLLPKKTQEHAALVQGLFQELEEAREKTRLLMNDEHASTADREAWAKKVTKCDNTLRKIFDELDAEWAKLVKEGRVVVDDLGMARVKPVAEATGTADEEEGDGGENAAGVQEENAAGQQELSSEQKARRRDLRKWLIDTRRGNGNSREKRVEQWHENFREYLALEGDKAFEDEKIREAIEHYGINVEKLKEGKAAAVPQHTEQ